MVVEHCTQYGIFDKDLVHGKGGILYVKETEIEGHPSEFDHMFLEGTFKQGIPEGTFVFKFKEGTTVQVELRGGKRDGDFRMHYNHKELASMFVYEGEFDKLERIQWKKYTPIRDEKYLKIRPKDRAKMATTDTYKLFLTSS